MDNSVLFVNAYVRKESRTHILAKKLISRLDMPCEEIRLVDYPFPAVNEDYLQKRDQLIAAGDFHHPMFDLARRFSKADTIVIAAPYWDLSFPAMLKQYLEQINVVGITFLLFGGRNTCWPLQSRKAVLCEYSRWAICPGYVWVRIYQSTGRDLLWHSGCPEDRSGRS